MPPLCRRREKFCEAFLRLGNAANAAHEAGYAVRSARQRGYILNRRPEVVERIAEMRAELGHLHRQNADILIGKLETVYNRALENHQFAAAARAVEVQARVARLAGTAAAPSGIMTNHDKS